MGAACGAAALVAFVVIYTRAGRFAPPQLFFKISSYVLYALAIVFRADPKRQMNDDLLRAKTALESGKTALESGTPRHEVAEPGSSSNA